MYCSVYPNCDPVNHFFGVFFGDNDFKIKLPITNNQHKYNNYMIIFEMRITFLFP